MIRVECPECGETFYREKNEKWKRLCIDCYITMKKREEEDSTINELNDRIKILEFSLVKHVNIAHGINKYWKRLVFACHPDRNGNEEWSHEVTQWLNRIRPEN